ncbi:MAG TPA: hypothetical protein VHB98_09685 [Chloroflexota bacterium]|nr:hypothetical protein [Chloroflexota bacterium]
MDELGGESDGLRFEVLASSLRADLTDTGLFLSALAEKLGGALPQQCIVERRGGLFAREKPIARVSVELGDYRYMIEKAGHGGLRAARTKVVRGIALKTEEMPVDEWIESLSRDLAQYATRNAQARMALERLLT